MKSTAAAALLFFLTACGGGGDSTGPARVASVEISPAGPSVQAGQTVQLRATMRDADENILTGRAVTWTTSNAAVAAIDESGLVTGVAPGTATITATSEGEQGTAAVMVTPASVASVQVSPPTAGVQVGQTVQLNATARDASGNDLTGRAFTWTSADPAVATVDASSGLVTGVAPGTVAISATAEGKSDTSDVTVVGSGAAVVLSTVAPDPMIEGQSATLTGSGFSPVPTENRVTVDGVAATVTSASTTSLQITVPAADCQPARTVDVRVRAAGNSSNVLTHPIRPAAFLELPVGQQAILQNPAEFCLQFPQSSDAEAYLIGVQSTSELVTSLTPVSLRAVAATPAAAAVSAPSLPALSRATAPGSADVVPTSQSAARWRRHYAAEAKLRESERRYLEPRIGRASRRQSRRGAVTTAAVPPDVAVGDTVGIRVPNIDSGNSCNNFIPITTVVRTIGTRGVWLEDIANPAGGYTTANFQSLSDMFDDPIYATDVEYFGEPTDFDGNGRTVIVTTKEVNKFDGPLGFVTSADLPPVECPSGNGGELYYGIAPDPRGTLGSSYSVADALGDAPVIVAHEFTHIIQFGRRLTLPGATAFQTAWEAEGQATFAQEIVRHRFTGRSTGQNYGFDVAFSDPPELRVPWYGGFQDLAFYYGFESRTSKVPNAPEQCSWLGRENNGPCLNKGRLMYGVTWSFLRWLSDQFGPSYPGGEQGLHRALIDNEFSGYATITDVVGVPIDSLLAQWAATLYVDDRVPGAAARLTLPSWNLFNIFDESLVESARLQPRERMFSSFADQITVRGGSTGYFRVSGTGRSATAIRARGGSNSPLPSFMRLWVVRLQ